MINEKKSSPMDSRYSIFSWNSEERVDGVGVGETEGISVIWRGNGGSVVVLVVQNTGKWRSLGRESEVKSWCEERKWSLG